MSNLSMEFFYDSHAADKWTVTVYAKDEVVFNLVGDTWEGIMEDLTYKTKWELEGVLPVTW
jgi:hypothetical protein